MSIGKVDHAALKINQIVIVSLNILAFVLDWPWLAAVVALVMVVGTALGKPGFGFVYHGFLKPRKLVQPDVLEDNLEPHRFAQGLGGAFMTVGSLALFVGAGELGWGLVWMVAGLAALNAFGGFCVGCALYYWLGQVRTPGFGKRPPTGTFPGRRPMRRVGAVEKME